MNKHSIDQLLKNFNDKTNTKGCFIVDLHGLIIFSDSFKANSDEELERIGALIAVENSIASKISLNVTNKEMEVSVIINDDEYIIIKLLKGDNILLSNHERNNNLDYLYEEIKLLSQDLNKML